jgi:RibD C-terminal domain
MRELIVTQNITLDGVIDAAEGWFDPSGEEEIDQSDMIAAVREAMATNDALLVGRVTFEQLRGYWPLQADDVTGVRDHLNQVEKYVVSRTLPGGARAWPAVVRRRHQAAEASPGRGPAVPLRHRPPPIPPMGVNAIERTRRLERDAEQLGGRRHRLAPSLGGPYPTPREG